MNWLKKKVIKWVQEERDESCGKSSYIVNTESSGMDRSVSEPSLNFRLYSAQNGDVLEFSKYDRSTDRNTVSIYIIDKQIDLGEFVAKCINLEILR
jgi:hypothetical protein